MMDINTINQIIQTYFEEHSDVNLIPVKKLMPDLIKAGVFVKDKKNGLPIRLVLRGLDEKNELDKIPFVHVVRKEGHSFWYFKRDDHVPKELEVDRIPPKELSKRELKKLVLSEETYVLDLCDELLGMKGLRHHTFEFLRGDVHAEGNYRNLLPCDIYYGQHGLVIEFDGHPHHPISDSQKEQRQLYAQRKRDLLPKNDIRIIQISHQLFELGDRQQIKRNRAQDKEKIKALLAPLNVLNQDAEEE